ncbi:MAG TPA: 50S ribosomal protein L16 [Candidatus Altiarchaeales archaeon]|nr:50S ribosomal protein L16 [Candidatus Altiarchaeales archaeon]
MASIRPAKCYRWDSPAYTRVAKNPQDSFISGIPSNKIMRYNMGNNAGVYDTKASIVLNEDLQIRHNALEAARVTTQFTLERKLGLANYFFKVLIYPHHVMRQNVQASGAGADRVSEGMRRAFGKPVGRAARVKAGQKIFTIYFNKNDARMKIVKSALSKACQKLPGDTKILVEENKK